MLTTCGSNMISAMIETRIILALIVSAWKNVIIKTKTTIMFSNVPNGIFLPVHILCHLSMQKKEFSLYDLVC
jgi:hypothetical protein